MDTQCAQQQHCGEKLKHKSFHFDDSNNTARLYLFSQSENSTTNKQAEHAHTLEFGKEEWVSSMALLC